MSREITAAQGQPGVRRTGNELLPSGSIIHWDERSPSDRRPMITCGCGCKVKRLAWVPKNKQGPMAGYCPLKGDKRRWRRRRDDVAHTSGAVIHWSVRAPKNRQKVGITCYQCGNEKFVKAETARDPKWSGRCFDCFKAQGGAHPRWNLQDELVAFGSIIHWSEWTTGLRLPVTCGICVANKASKTKREIHRSNIPPKAIYQKTDYMLFCRSHKRAEVAIHLSRFQNGNGPEKGSRENGKDVKSRNRERWLREAVNNITVMWERMRNSTFLSYQDKLDRITQVALASEIGIGKDKDPDSVIEVLRNRLIECGVRDMFFGSGSWYDSFVQTVVEEIERGLTSEQIVLNLKSRLARSCSAT